MQAFLPSHAVLPRARRTSGSSLCGRRGMQPVAAAYLQPGSFNVDLTMKSRSGNFGAVFFGLMQEDADEEGAESQTSAYGGNGVVATEVVVKLPVDNDIGRKLFDMERHSNAKLARELPASPRRVADYVGELIVPPEMPVAPGLARLGLVWRRTASDDTLEDLLRGSQVTRLASLLGTSATHSPLRRSLAAALLRELALMLSDIQSCGIVHRDIKPANILVVPGGLAGGSGDARLQMIDFGSSCDWASPLKKGLGLATIDPVYGAPERRLNIFRPAPRFDVYSIGLIALRVALPSLTEESAMQRFVKDVLARSDGSFERAMAAVRSGRFSAGPDVVRDFDALDDPANSDLFATLSTMLAERPEDRADVADCLQSRFLRSAYVV